jgi:hypothetical protein
MAGNIIHVLGAYTLWYIFSGIINLLVFTILQQYIADSGVREVLQKHPHCQGVLPSFWVSQKQRAPPVWVDAAVSVESVPRKSPAASPSQSHRQLDNEPTNKVLSVLHDLAEQARISAGSSMTWWSLTGSASYDYGQCLDAYAATVKSAPSPVLYSTHKATPAAEVLCW